MEYIYKITNDYDDKIYIGVTNNPQHRWYEHRYVTPLYKSLIHEAIVKHGEEHFNFQVIEKYIDRDEVLKREKELIALFNCMAPNGYNIHEGGGAPPLQNKISLEQAKSIRQDLINNILTKEEIIKKYGITTSILYNINFGHSWIDTTLQYPIRPSETEWIEERASKVKYLLKHSDKTQKEIGKQLGLSRSVISAINSGVKFYDENEIYPLRKPLKGLRGKGGGKHVLQIDINTLEIINEFISAAEAGRQTGINSNSISKCCRGEQQTGGGYRWQFK